MTFRISRRHFPASLSLHRRRRRHRRSSRCRISAAPPTGRSSPHGVQSGDVGADGGVVWARADRPSQMLVEVATSESFANARALPPIAALPESDFTAKMLLENLPAGQEIFYRVRFRDLVAYRHRKRARGRAFPHRAGRSPRRQFRLGRRRCRTGLGHQPGRRRHVHLRHHAQASPGFPAALRRHRLCRRTDQERGDASRRQGLEECDDPGEGKGRRNARRIPRRAQVQFHGRAFARVQRRGADLRAVGRPRSHQQLVAVEGIARGLQGTQHHPARRPRGARVPRNVSDAREHRGAGPGLSHAQLRPASRRVHAGRAQLSRPQWTEPADRLRARKLLPRARAARLAETGADEFARHLEGDRIRHAAQHHRL